MAVKHEQGYLDCLFKNMQEMRFLMSVMVIESADRVRDFVSRESIEEFHNA